MDKALDMFQNYDYDGSSLTIKALEVTFSLGFYIPYSLMVMEIIKMGALMKHLIVQMKKVLPLELIPVLLAVTMKMKNSLLVWIVRLILLKGIKYGINGSPTLICKWFSDLDL